MAIITQSMIVNLTQSKLPPIIMHRDEQGRRIIFYVVDENGDIIILNNNYSARFQMLKPDGNFIYENMSISDAGDKLTLNQTAQMTTVNGISYYDISIYSGSDMIYTGQGRVIIDDHIIDDNVIASVSEVNGLIFPDDFLTIDSDVASIDDNDTSLSKTWSSQKINNQISSAISTAEGYTDAAIAALPSPLHVYSTTEHVVGTWIDGSTVYEKTYIVDIEVANYSWTNTGYTVGNISKVISVVAGNNVGTCWNALFCAVDQTYIRLTCPRNADTINANWFTIRYTKSS